MSSARPALSGAAPLIASPPAAAPERDPSREVLLTAFAEGSSGAAPPPGAGSPAITPGTVVGHYRVLEPLATGGMGEVFVGEHIHLGRRVAIKFLHRRLVGDRDALARFTAEAIATSRIHHPGVVGLLDFGPHAGGAYLVTELLSGETLTDLLAREGRLSIDTAIDLGAQLADALATAHRAGVVHRDLKPDNIALLRDPARRSGLRAVVLDFGVAKLDEVLGPPLRTLDGNLLGTPLYMAPEQSQHASAVDHRSDIYALGCVLYRVLCGDVPFRGTLMQILMAHQRVAPRPPRELRPEVPLGLDALILAMLAKAPTRRPPTMTHVARALEGMAGERAAGAPRTWLGRLLARPR